MVLENDKVPYKLYFARGYQSVPDKLKKIYDDSTSKKFDFISIPLFPTDIQRKRSPSIPDFCYIKSDLDCKNWQKVIVQIGYNLDLDSPDTETNRLHKYFFKQEIQLAAYLEAFAILLPFPKGKSPINYLKTLQKVIQKKLFGHCQIWLEVPLSQSENDEEWQIYTQFKQSLQINNLNLGVCLKIIENLPSKNIQRRWLAEYIQSIQINPNLFVLNNKGHPILIGHHDELVKGFFKFDVTVIINASKPEEDVSPFRSFVCFLFDKQNKMTDLEWRASQYYDVLQDPLQPYKNNLQAATYKIFEEDVVKYDYYENAVYQALLKRSDKDGKIIIFLVGAGRAPILQRILLAAENAKRQIFLYAIEKNPFAFMTIKALQKQNDDKWSGKVEIIQEDAKLWKPKEKADIIVSELLGSFGCNELSPECLSWVEPYLKPDGISIPSKYTSYITPVSCQPVYNKIKKLKSYQQQLESTQIIQLKYHYLPSSVQECFSFVHPNKSVNGNFKQYKKLEFEFKESNLIHGFYGFFDTILFGDVILSTHLANHTPEMFSWFPILFPLTEPLYVTENQRIYLYIWRCSNKQQVWYEWMAEIDDKLNKQIVKRTNIHNFGGLNCSVKF